MSQIFSKSDIFGVGNGMRVKFCDICGLRGKIGILMMFLPHLILANHFNEKGLCENIDLTGKKESEGNYLDISDVFDRSKMKKWVFYLDIILLFFPFYSPLQTKKKVFRAI